MKPSIIFITGMSGTGKSTVLTELARRGYRTIDTDYGGWCVDNAVPDASVRDWVWNERRMTQLLAEHTEGALFISGCVSNQGTFYHLFDEIVLLEVSIDILFARITSRTENLYGHTSEEWSEILRNISEVEPLLRKTATRIINTDAPLHEVADILESFVQNHRIT